ncbi:hypothetical protein [Bacillus altitudinis]|uniref:hypothetical protein n=1 Tax=Bacillus altitudinis TaxID=293387 RepID=UPI003019363D
MNSKHTLKKTTVKKLFNEEKISKEALEKILAKLENEANFIDQQKNKRKELIKKARNRIFENV